MNGVKILKIIKVSKFKITDSIKRKSSKFERYIQTLSNAYLVSVYKVLEFLKTKIFDELFTFRKRSDAFVSAS